jgi:L-threonylcarbamoyladenylate synthase
MSHCIDYILDGGKCTIGIESTIVRIDQNKATVLRLGGLSIEYLEDILQQKITLNNQHTDQPTAPGMLGSHYAPHKRLILVDDLHTAIHTHIHKRFAVLSLDSFFDNVPTHLQFRLSSTGNMHAAAAALFDTLHTIDALNIDLILAQKLPDTGLGKAINDRLQRAAF